MGLNSGFKGLNWPAIDLHNKIEFFFFISYHGPRHKIAADDDDKVRDQLRKYSVSAHNRYDWHIKILTDI